MVIGMPAMLIQWKGQDLFLRAFARAARGKDDIYALVVGDAPDGDGAYRDSLERLAGDLGVADRVVFASFCEEPARWLACMDVVVHASLEPEPLGLTVLEAMAAGKPVVAAGAGGVRETVLPGRTGLLYPIGDEAALADRLQRLIENPSLRAALGRRGADHVQTSFDLFVSRKKIVDLYHLNSVGARVTFDRKMPCRSEPCFS
jgi:glycosyltransferase involved in cell wall biosynthesis